MILNLGCGDRRIKGTVGVDSFPGVNPDVVADIRDLPFSEEYAEKVYFYHVLEHIPFNEWDKTLKGIRRVLKPWGKLILECPDIVKIISLCKEGIRIPLDVDLYNKAVYGLGGFHLSITTDWLVKRYLEMCGFVDVKIKLTELENWDTFNRQTNFRIEARKPATVGIIIPTYNNVNCMVDCVRSIIHNTDFRDVSILVVNNGDTIADEHDWTKVKVLNENVNLGWVGGINIGIEWFEKNNPRDFYIFCNDDIEITEGDVNWLNRLLGGFHDGIGAVGPISDYVMWSQAANLPLPMHHYTNLLIGFFMMIRAEAARKIGGMDERFSPGGNDDLDYSIRIQEGGYKLCVVRDVFIHHRGCQTLPRVFGGNGGVVARDELTRKMLIEKWGQQKVDNLFNTEVFTNVED
jgi:GT2 family glycosyltransferase